MAREALNGHAAEHCVARGCHAIRSSEDSVEAAWALVDPFGCLERGQKPRTYRSTRREVGGRANFRRATGTRRPTVVQFIVQQRAPKHNKRKVTDVRAGDR